MGGASYPGLKLGGEPHSSFKYCVLSNTQCKKCTCHLVLYCSLVKKDPWAVHLTLASNRGVGRHSSHQYCVLLSSQSGANSVWPIYTSIILFFKFSCLVYRQIDKVAHQRVQQSISSDKKMKEVKQEGDKRISQMKQQLKEEQTKSRQKEEEIDKLRR